MIALGWVKGALDFNRSYLPSEKRGQVQILVATKDVHNACPAGKRLISIIVGNVIVRAQVASINRNYLDSGRPDAKTGRKECSARTHAVQV